MNRKAFTSSMPCRYKTFKDLSDRLSGTICRYDGQVVYVHVDQKMHVEPEPRYETIVTIYEWPDTEKKIGVIDPEDPKFDISLIEVGYFNYLFKEKNLAVYAFRSTRKQWKQGMSASQVYLKGIDGAPANVGSSSLQSMGFVDSIDGRFPDISILDSVSEAALSQELAVRRDTLGVLEFFWRTHKIAVKVPGQKIHRLESEFSWVVDKVLGGLM